MTGFFDGIVNGLEAKVQKGPALDGLESAKKTDLDQFPISPFLPVASCTAIQPLLFLYPCLTNCLLENLTCLHHNYGLGPDHLPCMIIILYKLSTHHIVKKNLYIEVYVYCEHT